MACQGPDVVRSHLTTWLFITFLVVGALIHSRANAQADRPIALVGGMLVHGYEAPPVHHATVIIEGNRIVAAGDGRNIAVPDDAEIIDVRGKTIMPGLIDLHVHLDLLGHGDYDRWYDYIDGTSQLDRIIPIAAEQTLRAGVTSVADVGTPFHILAVRERVRSGEIPGPRMTISGPWITRVSLDGVPPEYQIVIDSPEEAATETVNLIDNGSDIIKTWVGLTEADYRAIVKAAHSRGVKVHSHLYQPDALRAALRAGVDVFQHAGSARNVPYDAALVAEIAQRRIPVIQTISHRIWVFPKTLAFPERLQDPMLSKTLPPAMYEEFQDSFQNFHTLGYFREIGLETRRARTAAKQFIAANAVMGVGTDAASPLNFHTEAMWHELAALVDSGMTPLQAISAATKTNAEILGKGNELGTIEAGKLADILVVNGNPLADINVVHRIDFVMKDGIPWFEGDMGTNRVLEEVGRRF